MLHVSKQTISLLTASLLLPFATYAKNRNCSSANLFHQHFYEALRQTQGLKTDPQIELRHYTLDESLMQMIQAQTIQDAMMLSSHSSLESLSKNTASFLNSQFANVSQKNLLKNKPITLVIVPGIFGEFIKTRPFEEVLTQASESKDLFIKRLNALRTQGVTRLTTDKSLELNKLSLSDKNLEDLVHVGAIKDNEGHDLVRIVFLYPPFASLETLGDLKEQAKTFNRRLEKYYQVMRDENLVIMGYSRGTTDALEMVVQAKTQNLSYLSKVRGVVSYAGVIFGSSLADETLTADSQTQELWQALQDLKNDLIFLDDNNNVVEAFKHNSIAFAKLLRVASKGSSIDLSEFPKIMSQARTADIQSTLYLVYSMWNKLDLNRVTEFNSHVRNFKYFIDQMMTGIAQLRTLERLQWWTLKELPKNIKYYSLSAAMANPNNSDFEKQAFTSSIGYNNTLDDLSLLQNQTKYQTMTGVSLNDSQVSIAQSSFLPNYILRLNSANDNLVFDNLGILGTHHWGVSLRTVNQQRDGKINPFPRAEVLNALAAVVANDLLNQNDQCPNEH